MEGCFTRMQTKVLEDPAKETVRADKVEGNRVLSVVFLTTPGAPSIIPIPIWRFMRSRGRYCPSWVTIRRLQHKVPGSLWFRFWHGLWHCPSWVPMHLLHHVFQLREHVIHFAEEFLVWWEPVTVWEAVMEEMSPWPWVLQVVRVLRVLRISLFDDFIPRWPSERVAVVSWSVMIAKQSPEPVHGRGGEWTVHTATLRQPSPAHTPFLQLGLSSAN